jgi:DNA-binding transcriptional LysR family regulator
METSLLKSFIAVAETSSFSDAATRVNLTQSTVSHQIARLEEHLGKQLFKRTTRACQLTADGMELLKHASKILASVDEMERSFKPMLLSGTVVVGLPDDQHLFAYLTHAIMGFRSRHPGVAVEIRAGLSADLGRDLKESRSDIAVLREIPALPGEELKESESLVWVTGQAWTMPSDGVWPLALVSGSCAYRRTALAQLNAAAAPWKCVVSCSSFEGVLSVVEANLAISLITQGDLRPGIIPADRELGLPELPSCGLSIRLSARQPSVAAQTLAETLASALSIPAPVQIEVR